MITAIVIGLIFFCLAGGIVYLVLYFPTKWLVKPHRSKIVRPTLSVLIGLPLTYWYLFTSPASNNKKATIENVDNQYLITMTGKRSLMVHDPISALKPGTYLDTFRVIIPRAEGTVNGEEIPTKPGEYKMLGSLTIDKEKMRLDLYYDNYDDKIKDPVSWNGEYKLQWKGN